MATEDAAVSPSEPSEPTRSVDLTLDELALALTALRLLRSTLGREEADELAEVTALIDKLGD